MSNDTLTKPQLELVAKLEYCADRVRKGCESNMEFSVIEYHMSNGCQLAFVSSKDDHFYIVDYVKKNF